MYEFVWFELVFGVYDVFCYFFEFVVDDECRVKFVVGG